MKLVAVRLGVMTKLPKCCDECVYIGVRPDPNTVWADVCELCSMRIDDNKNAGWYFDGTSRPKNCPLFEAELEEDV